MKHFIASLIAFLITSAAFIDAQVTVVSGGSAPKNSKNKDEKSYFYTSIKDATWKRDVENGFVVPFDNDGNPLDTIKASGFKWTGMETVQTSDVSIPVAKGDTSVIFEVGAPGYETQTIHWTFKPFAKRERSRLMDPLFLNKIHALKEVTVTATKVKFYNKGDTIVYDASAFQLAEGSMLDALVAQLPGASIDENGRISVNGEFVETLLLNGKDLFKNDNKIMLENIPAYTVKNIEVYKGHTKEEKLEGDTSAPRHLTMDVKLKKEYSHGWLLNIQAGYGTADRYLGRLFASWFSPTTSVVITGASNNLNDNRTPGKDDSWTPESMPSGTITTHSGSIKYVHETVDGSLEARGSLSAQGGSSDYRTSTSVTNFLSGGDSYERRFSNQNSKNFSIDTWHSAYYRFNSKHWASLSVGGDYSKTDNRGRGLSGTFNRDYSDISIEALENIYGNTSEEALKAIVNRSATLSEGSLRSGSFNFRPTISLMLPNSNDRISFGLTVTHTRSKRHSWNDYEINFGDNPAPAERRRQYTDESPNYRTGLGYNLSYMRNGEHSRLYVSYDYRFTDAAKDSYMYALERLDDMGAFGVLPTDYASTLDPSNSYTSRTFTNSHMLNIQYNYSKKFERSRFMVMIMPSLGIEHNRLDYWRDNRSYLVRRSSFEIPQTYATVWLNYDFGKADSGDGQDSPYARTHYNHNIEYRPSIHNQAPQLLHLVDVVNDADPLNIQEGNPGLHNAYVQNHRLSWRYTPEGKPISNQLRANLEIISDALVRGYVYNTATGVRRYKTYNVGGNTNFNMANYFNWEFGRSKQFSLSSSTSWSLNNSTDMVGINEESPSKAQVRNLWLSEILSFSYKIGKQTIGLHGNVSHRNTTSERPDFNPIDAQHYKYGIKGIFSLPAGFGASTDFYFYKRVGYGVRELDTTDAIWNLRLTYTPKGNRWVISADGFDLLHKLSNVNYAVTATGRTVTYTNTLPRYFIVTVQYRLNIQPKK